MNALAAAREARIELRNLAQCLAKARGDVLARQDTNGGFGYNGTKPVGASNGHYTLTGAGVRGLQICGSRERDAELRGVRYILHEGRLVYEAGPCNLYELYFNCRAMAERGGEAWTAYQEVWRDELIEHQLRDGSWPKPEGTSSPGTAGDAHDFTCLATLVLESYYR